MFGPFLRCTHPPGGTRKISQPSPVSIFEAQHVAQKRAAAAGSLL
jgi:hypothetical protein